MTGEALSMRMKLERLRRQHAHELHPVTVPMTAETSRSQVLSGRATTTTVDLQRQRFRCFAFGAIRPPFPKLHFRHATGRQVGTVDRLEYNSDGEIVATVTVDCPLARRANAFSIGATVKKFEIVDADDPEKYHALITEAVIEELSLTDQPANPRCLISSRRDVSATAAFYETAAMAVSRMSQIITQLQRMEARR